MTAQKRENRRETPCGIVVVLCFRERVIDGIMGWNFPLVSLCQTCYEERHPFLRQTG